MPKVFISYSHDSPEHSERVLSLAWALRGNGIDVELDQFHGEEITDWLRWCNEQTSHECSDFVVCICTAEYRRRIEGKVPPEKGKGVYWEGSLLDDDIYDTKGNSRLIPILFEDEPETSIPRFLSSTLSYYSISTLVRRAWESLAICRNRCRCSIIAARSSAVSCRRGSR